MTTKFIIIPPDQNFDIPEGFRVVEFYGATLFGARPTSALITDEHGIWGSREVLTTHAEQKPDMRVYKPENVLWGPGEFTYSGNQEASEICGVQYSGVFCSFPPHAKGRHSFEPEDSSDTVQVLPEKELYPNYYEGGDDLEPWDVIKAFNLDYWRATALVYVIRAGRKPGSSEIDDLRKAYTFLGERLDQLNALAMQPADEYTSMGEYIKKRYSAEPVKGYSTSKNPDEGLHGAY